jgi:hypothetical protein
VGDFDNKINKPEVKSHASLPLTISSKMVTLTCFGGTRGVVAD